MLTQTLLSESLEATRCRFFRIHDGRVEEEAFDAISEPTLLRQGNYFAGHPRSPLELWRMLRLAWAESQALVLLPVSLPAEQALYLRQLPSDLPEATRLVVFTSGSVGEPKAVLHTEQSLLASASQLATAFSHVDAMYCALPSCGMAGFAFQVLLPLAKGGASVYFSSDLFFYEGARLPKIFLDHSIDLCILNPFLVRSFLQLVGDNLDFSRTRFVSLTAPLAEHDKQSFLQKTQRPIDEIYGMSEAAGPVLLNGITLGAQVALSAEGEVLLAGPQLFSFYSREGNLIPATVPFATGDVGVEGGGRISVRGRRRELIDVAGRKIAPELVEQVLLDVPGVADVMAFSYPDTYLGERVAVLLRVGEAWSEAEFLKVISAKLSRDAQPARWRVVEEIPRHANGKPLRRQGPTLIDQG